MSYLKVDNLSCHTNFKIYSWLFKTSSYVGGNLTSLLFFGMFLMLRIRTARVSHCLSYLVKVKMGWLKSWTVKVEKLNIWKMEVEKMKDGSWKLKVDKLKVEKLKVESWTWGWNEPSRDGCPAVFPLSRSHPEHLFWLELTLAWITKTLCSWITGIDPG